MVFKLFEGVETIVVEQIRNFFKEEPAVESFANIDNYRWNENPDETEITISTVWPDKISSFPIIRVNVSNSSHQEIGFNQYEFLHRDAETEMEWERIGGIQFVSVNFVVGATSRLSMKRIADILDLALVARSRIWNKLVKRNIIPVGNPVLNFTGTSEEVLSSRERIYKGSFQYPRVRVEWYEDVGIPEEYIKEVKHFPVYY